MTDQEILGPYSASSNFTVDLTGSPDDRPSTWGDAGVQSWKQLFHPPGGYRVRILRLVGDLTAWPKILPADAPVGPGLVSGLLVGFQTTAKEGSDRVDYAADNTMLYVQDAVGAAPEKTRTPLNCDVSVGGLLEADNALVIVAANFLNDTGTTIHMEVTYTVTYQFEKGVTS